MPELPEVETIKNALVPRIVGRRVTGVELFWPRAVHVPSSEDLRAGLIGKRIESIARRGKYLLFRLSSGQTLILHLKMSGVLLLKPSGEARENHTTAVFRLDGGADLHFIDQRKFGSIWLVADEDEVIGKLGPEPLGNGFSTDRLRDLAAGRHVPIKVLLCDQNAVAGIGNMWADEALFAARIHPMRSAGGLTAVEIDRLHAAIREVLERGISQKGASVNTYRIPNGESGTAHSEFQVAHRRGEKCPACGTALGYIKVRGRGTHFCPKCQKG
ncbi:MAG: bifunctional DNA-formamidopyrimidine glycosylase/DNA-(apurinic or apyrimidinic site) lyase [Chloroflexi bacterium]|nr:bifunctional DNA-formamidopyrimidine glycosylase/DNA-(apurinic or apyrimidinic site) lyase [Chloroflexota bacterium]